MSRRLAVTLLVCVAGAIGSGLFGMLLWQWVSNAPTSGCYGLNTVSGLGLARFWTEPFTSNGSVAWVAAYLALPFGLVATGILVALRWNAAWGWIQIVLAWLLYGFIAFSFITMGC